MTGHAAVPGVASVREGASLFDFAVATAGVDRRNYKVSELRTKCRSQVEMFNHKWGGFILEQAL